MIKMPLMLVVLLGLSMIMTACGDSTPAPVAALIQQVTDASKSRSMTALRACYAQEGVTKAQIESETGSWDSYFDPQQNYTLSGITYVSMADASTNKSILPDTIAMAQGETLSGMKFAPNIKVIGFIVIAFDSPSMKGVGPIEMVGIAADGTAKIALVEPQK